MWCKYIRWSSGWPTGGVTGDDGAKDLFYGYTGHFKDILAAQQRLNGCVIVAAFLGANTKMACAAFTASALAAVLQTAAGVVRGSIALTLQVYEDNVTRKEQHAQGNGDADREDEPDNTVAIATLNFKRQVFWAMFSLAESKHVAELVQARHADPANADMNWLLDTMTLNTHVTTAADLSRHFFFEGRSVAPDIKLDTTTTCYQCGKKTAKVHGFYVHCCAKCGARNYAELQHQHSPEARALVQDRTFVVIGGRTKIGYQVALRLLRAGAAVHVTTRFPAQALDTYKKEPDFAEWHGRLFTYFLDLNSSASRTKRDVDQLVQFVVGNNVTAVDGLFVVAAQTIRGIERHAADGDGDTNRYGNAKHFPDDQPNSWQLTIPDVSAEELEEVMRVNTVGPFLIFQGFRDLLLASSFERRMVVNTHAREGCFNVCKSPFHPHTNMAKAALHMLTRMIDTTRYLPAGASSNVGRRQRRRHGLGISCYGIDPGWVSVDEYSSSTTPMQSAPLTELDGATRLLYPLFVKSRRHIPTGCTLRHFDQILV